MTPESPLTVESREELVYLLGEACELEHGLMCEYLYAQFSLKRGVEEGLTPEQLTRVQAWETSLIDVIKQEMLHLALATNILTAVGAAPHFERPNFPISSRWYPSGVQIALLPFGEQALRHFMYLERPEGMDLVDAEGFVPTPEPEVGSIDAAPFLAVPEPWQTVGHLYRGISAGLSHLSERYGEDAVFIGAPTVQTTTEIFEWEELTAVTDLASALRAIDLIVTQGEGVSGDWVDAHFGKFVGILEDFLSAKEADPDFNPVRPVEPAYVRLPPDVRSGILIEEPLTARVADFCNGLYEVILQVLCRYYAHFDETSAELDTLARTAKHLMNLGLASCCIGTHEPADRSFTRWSHCWSDPGDRPPRVFRSSPSRRRLEDSQRAPRRSHGYLQRTRQRACARHPGGSSGEAGFDGSGVRRTP